MQVPRFVIVAAALLETRPAKLPHDDQREQEIQIMDFIRMQGIENNKAQSRRWLREPG